VQPQQVGCEACVERDRQRAVALGRQRQERVELDRGLTAGLLQKQRPPGLQHLATDGKVRPGSGRQSTMSALVAASIRSAAR